MANIYNFYKTSAQLKKEAKEELSGYKGIGAACTLLYWAIFLILGGCFFINIAWLKYVLIALIVLLYPPLTLGLCKFSMNSVGDTAAKITDLFFGFKHYFKAFAIFIVCLIEIVFLTIFLIIPGIKQTMKLSMCYYVLIDNPKLKVNEILKTSSSLMNNHEWRLLRTILSFVGWLLLGLLSIGIGYLFILPHLNGSLALFYADLKD